MLTHSGSLSPEKSHKTTTGVTLKDLAPGAVPILAAGLLAVTEQFWQAIITGLIAGLVALGVALINSGRLNKKADKVGKETTQIHSDTAQIKTQVEPDHGFSMRDVFDRMEKRQIMAEERHERVESKVDSVLSIKGKVQGIEASVKTLGQTVGVLVTKVDKIERGVVEGETPADPLAEND